MRETIENYLYDLTKKYSQADKTKFSASSISEQVGLNRSTVSSYLNEAFRQQTLLKIKTYPVSFLHKKAFTETFFETQYLEYNSFEELFAEAPSRTKEKDPLETVIGAFGSLKEKINQIKTAAMYPNGGLPVMLLGASGSGKTFLAEKIYEYMVEKQIIDFSAPYVAHNCAQYFNNPELLSSVLFGYAKGAFTGADTNKEGLLDAADGGVLFLDEVHRLSEEGQEKLFTFMDTGEYSPIGNDSIKKKANIHLIFATTENIESTFLPTFLRRLPVVVSLPNFYERPQPERLQLIDQFFIQESNILQKELSVSSKVIHFLIDADLEGNVGKVKNLIKFACGNAYAKQDDNQKINIKLLDIPVENLLQPYPTVKMDSQYNINERVYLPNTEIQPNLETSERKKLKTFFTRLLEDYKKIESGSLSPTQFISFATENVILLMDEFIFFTPEDRETFFSFITYNIRSAFQFMNENYGFDQDGNKTLSIANYLYVKESQDFLFDNADWANLKNSLLQFLEEQMKDEVWLARRFLNSLSLHMDNEVLDEDIVFIAFYLHSMNLALTNSNNIKAIVLAHGYSTASSMANVANRMLQKNIFQAYDMPLGITVNEVEKKVLQYIENYQVERGLIVLIDMGSLNIITEKLMTKIQSPLLVIDSFNTPLLLEVGNLINNSQTIFEISEQINDFLPIRKQLATPKTDKKKAVITCCYTGMGSAVQIKEILQKSLGETEETVTVLPYDYQKLKENKRRELPFQMYNVLAIVGTENPEIDNVPYFGLDKLVNGELIDDFVQIMVQKFAIDGEALKQELIFNFSLKKMVENLTILDADRVLNLVSASIGEMQRVLEITFDANKKYLLFLHISCMIERILRKEEVDKQEDIQSYIKSNRLAMEKIHRCLQNIEEKYTIKISDLELRLINDIIFN
ncbi:transcriptional antiterminator [Alicyclobacillus contaminans]|nr:transcriptional antiterminator [Alicyclobacillus contaminans]